MGWSETGKARGPFFLVLSLVFTLIGVVPLVKSAEVGDKYYSIWGSGVNYNGSTMGYIMSWDNDTIGTGPQGRYYLRVAFSVDRPAFWVGDSIGAMIRSDGYFSRDSGWWYTVKNASIDFIEVYYPNASTAGETTSTIARNLTGRFTDATGVWRNETLLLTDEKFPMGRYRARVAVTGPAGVGSTPSLSGIKVGMDGATRTNYTLVYFDLTGPLDLIMSPIPDVAKNTQISINGTVNQPNGKRFNYTEVQGLGSFSYWVNITVTQPNLTIARYYFNTTNGSYAVTYTPTSVGKYYAIAYVETDIGNDVERGKHTFGRTFDKFTVTGTWPEVSMAFAGTPLRAILALAAGLYFRRGRRREHEA